MPACRCQFCAAPLEPVQEFRFLVESATADDPVRLATIRRLPAAAGRPLRACKTCQGEWDAQPTRFRLVLERAVFRREVRSGMLAAAGLLSVAWLFGAVLRDAG